MSLVRENRKDSRGLSFYCMRMRARARGNMHQAEGIVCAESQRVRSARVREA